MANTMNDHRTTRETSSTGGTTRVKTTTYETRNSYGLDPSERRTEYRPLVTPRQVVINRTVVGGPSMSRSLVLDRSFQQLGASPGFYASVTSTGVDSVKRTHEKEKRDMQDLNERFASYIEKVRFLEAQNRRLADELEKLRAKWGKETTQVKAMYEAELDEARRLLDDAEKEKARLQIRVDTLEEQVNDLNKRLSEACNLVDEFREKIEEQNRQMSEYEAEISQLRRRVQGLDADRERDKRTITQLQDTCNRTRIDLDNETLMHVDAENRRQTLEEELEFLKQVHEQEMKELANLAYRDTTPENREFWKNEMGQALREIQTIYDEKIDLMRTEMESFYNLKIQEFRTGATRQNLDSSHAKEESKRLRVKVTELQQKLGDLETRNFQLQRELDALRREKEERERELQDENATLQTEGAKLRAELDAVLKELQNLMDTKLGLELEIAAYRKLLEGEENRVGLRDIVDHVLLQGSAEELRRHQSLSRSTEDLIDSALKVSQVVKGEMSAKTTSRKSFKGLVAVSESSPDGKYILLENVGRREQVLEGWKLVRNIDGKDIFTFEFDRGYSLKTSARAKVWARGQRPFSSPEGDLEAVCQSWGTGSNVVTTLVDPAGTEQASHQQLTTYSS